MKQSSSSKKRNYISPQKTQTSIVAFSNTQKKQNSSITPPRTAIERSLKAITAGPTPSSPPKTLILSNNPYKLLADQEDSTNTSSGSQEMYSSEASTKGVDTDGVSVSSEGLSSPEKALLSRKAQQALRKIRSARRVLMDNSVRAEIEAAYGAGCVDSISQDTLSGSTKPLDQSTTDVDMTNAEDNAEDDAGSISFSTLKPPQLLGSDGETPHEHATHIAVPQQTIMPPASQDGTSSGYAQPTRNVSFAEAAAPKSNSSLLRKGNLSGSAKAPPSNPYAKKLVSGIMFAQRSPPFPARVDKAITLKKNNTREHIHRYTLRFKSIKAKSEDEGHVIVKETLQRFLEIVLQADPKTIMPPYLELDRNDKSVSDLSAAFPVSSVDSYHVMKKYFFRLSPRDEAGISWCSIILAQAMPFPIFMEKAKYSLENNDFSLWPKASDNENTTDVGWLLYSTRAQDEDRLSALLSKITGENIGVKWKPIRSSTANIRKKDQGSPEEKIKALHIECAVDRLQEVRDKLTFWYSSSSRQFPDGTKMRLVPTINSVNSMNNKTKFASCLARQAALNAGLASAITREISTNLLLDRQDPTTKKSFRQILMEISPQRKPGTTLFHTIDRQFKSDVIVNFQFHPENASEANNLIAGLVPFLKDNGHSFHLKMFTPEALQRQAKSKWNWDTREADSEIDAELANLLAEDDDLNFTDEPTLEKVEDQITENNEPVVNVHIPEFPAEHMPSMQPDEDSVSTFHPGKTINLTDDPDNEDDTSNPKSGALSPVGILRTPRSQDCDAISRISMSDSATRISSLETEISAMDKAFRTELEKLRSQASVQATAQAAHGTILSEILTTLKNLTVQPPEVVINTSEVANPPQTLEAGGSHGVAGHG